MADIADNAAVCGAFVFGDLHFVNEKTGVCAGYVVYPLKQSSQFVCGAVFPHLSVFVQFDEMLIFEHVTCCVVNDRADEVFRCVRGKVRRKSIALSAGGHVRGCRWHLVFCKDMFRDDTVNHVGCTYVEASMRGGG